MVSPIYINIADLTTCLHTTDEVLASRLRLRYGQFLDESKPTPHLDIKIETVPDALYVEPEPGDWVIDIEYRENTLHYRSYMEQGYVNLETGQGCLQMNPKSYVENFLRVAYAWLCLRHDALLLHASGMIRHSDQLGYVFFGHSGAGKTTTTRLSETTASILSDDLIIIRTNEHGCTLHGVPFRGVYGDPPRANQQAPLKGIFRLNQADEHKLERLPRSIGVAELAGSAPFVNNKPVVIEHLMMVCGTIADKVDLLRLHFKKDNQFWNVIDGYYQNIP